MARYPADHKDRVRRQILAAAEQAVLRDGLSTGLDGVMSAVGLTKGGFYTHFRNKDELLAATLEDALARQRDDAERVLNNGDARSVRDLFEGYLAREVTPNHPDRCLIPRCLNDFARASSVVRKPYEGHRRWLAEAIARRLQGARRLAQRRAAALIALAYGAASVARVAESPRQRRQMLLAARSAGRHLLDEFCSNDDDPGESREMPHHACHDKFSNDAAQSHATYQLDRI